MKLEPEDFKPIREVAGALAFGWNEFAKLGIVPGMKQYDEPQLTERFNALIIAVAGRMPEGR